jgi:hypothetical protein
LVELDVDELLISQMNKDMKEIEQELSALHELFELLGIHVYKQKEDLEEIEQKVTNSDVNVQIATNTLKEANIIRKKSNKKIIKIIGGATVGGLLFGGVGAAFGIIPTLVGTGIGIGAGSIVPSVVTLFKKI